MPAVHARRRSSVRILTYVAAAGLAFQLVHFTEHVAQLGYWFIHPELPPWLTPWALAGRGLLSDAPLVGNELLHLVGNNIFLTGLIALKVISLASGGAHAGRANLTKALWIQGFHVLEHLLLTFTLLLLGEASGFSTLFGALSNATLWTYRVWWHFAINLFATVYATRAAKAMYDEGLVLSGPMRRTAIPQI